MYTNDFMFILHWLVAQGSPPVASTVQVCDATMMNDDSKVWPIKINKHLYILTDTSYKSYEKNTLHR